MKYLISFKSVHYALDCELKLEDKGYNLRTIPTPREISLSCGISVLVDTDNIENLSLDIKESKIDYKNIYIYRKEGIKTVLEEL